MTIEEKNETANQVDNKNTRKKTKKNSSETKKVKDEIGQLKSKNEELNDKYTRLVAEFDNYKKRTDKEFILLIQNANEKLITEILPVVDDLERSLGHLKEGNDFEALLNGFKLINKNLYSLLEKQGLKPMKSVGEDFDPEKHDALMQVENKKVKSNKIVDEHLKGYLFNDKVIRHAQVVVSK
jgi:molecular chaperone GrpE